MTAMTPKSRGQFSSMKLTLSNAIGQAYDMELKAIAEGDANSADSLFAKRKDLSAELSAIRQAEIAYLNSELGVAEAEAILVAQAQRAKDALAAMVTVNTTLQGLATLLGLFTALAAFF